MAKAKLAKLSSPLAEDERAKHTRKTRESEWDTDPENPKNQCSPPTTVLAAIEKDNEGTASNPELVKRIWATARLLWSKQKEIATLTEKLAEAAAEEKRLKEEVLPEMLSEAQTKELTSDTGVMLEKKDKVYANISKDNMPAAIGWFEKNGFGAIVKCAFSIPLDKGDTKTAKLIRRLMKTNKLAYEERSSVHPQTLLAFVRESIEIARQLPESITHHIQPTVEIKLPKVKKTTNKFVSDSNDINV